MYLWEKVKENLDSFYYSLGPPINRVVRLTCGPHEASAYPSVVTPLSLLLAQSLGHLLPNPRSWCPAPHARARLAICVMTKATSQCAPLHYTCPYRMCVSVPAQSLPTRVCACRLPHTHWWPPLPTCFTSHLDSLVRTSHS
jgi:hypothetical protein